MAGHEIGQPVQRVRGVKGFGVELQGHGRGEAARAATAGLLGALRVGRAVGAGEKTALARSGGSE